MVPKNNLQFQYFWGFNKRLEVTFSQESWENFWPYLLGEVVMAQNH